MAKFTGLSEKQIENTILHWLNWRGFFCWKTKTMGTFDKRSGRYLRGSRLYRTGVSDIIGILDSGKLFAIEVKSEKGRVQDNQKLFLSEIKAKGGLAFIARSVDDIEREFKLAGVL